MEFKNGASVFSSEAKEVGSLQRVVIKPLTDEVTHIVIHKGLLFVTDKVIPIVKVSSANENRVNLSCTVDELDEMSPLEIEQARPAREAINNDTEYVPLANDINANPLPDPYLNTEVRRTIADDLIALKLGASALSRSDKQLGRIERVYTNSETGKVTHFVISQGLLVKENKSVPYEWVSTIMDDEVGFVIDDKQFDNLPANQDQ